MSLNTIGIHDRLNKLMQRTRQLSYQAELTYITYLWKHQENLWKFSIYYGILERILIQDGRGFELHPLPINFFFRFSTSILFVHITMVIISLFQVYQQQ